MFEELELVAEKAAAERRRIVSSWISSGSSSSKLNTRSNHNVPSVNRLERLGLGAKPEKNRQASLANNVFTGLATKRKLTSTIATEQTHSVCKGPKALNHSDDEDSRAKSVGKVNSKLY